jgi:hypothetical protein
MVAGYGAGLAPAPEGRPPSWSAVVASAIAARDDHAIKLAGACSGEYRVDASPVFAAAAQLGADVLAVPVLSAPEPAQ